MKNSSLASSLKGLLMAIITFLAGIISTSGFPKDALGWKLLGITVLGTVLIYLGKNAVFPATKVFDILSGLIVAVGTGISNWVANLIMGTAIDWHSLLIMIASVVAGYFAKNALTKTSPSAGDN